MLSGTLSLWVPSPASMFDLKKRVKELIDLKKKQIEMEAKPKDEEADD